MLRRVTIESVRLADECRDTTVLLIGHSAAAVRLGSLQRSSEISIWWVGSKGIYLLCARVFR